MPELQLEIPAPAGVAEAFLYISDDGPHPGVLFLTDIGGIRPSQRQMAEHLASRGFAVLMPNAFYRTGKAPLFNVPFKPGDEEFMKRVRELSAPLTPEAMQGDTAAYLDFLTSHVSVRKGGVGTVGLCFTGKMAMYAAATRPEKVAAAASFHGGGLFVEGPASPHLVLPRIRARLYFGHATEDRGMNADAIQNFDAALADWGGRYESEVYEGAHHGWTVPDSPSYNPVQAERAFEKLLAVFREALPDAEGSGDMQAAG